MTSSPTDALRADALLSLSSLAAALLPPVCAGVEADKLALGESELHVLIAAVTASVVLGALALTVALLLKSHAIGL